MLKLTKKNKKQNKPRQKIIKAEKAPLSQQAHPLIFNITAARHVNISYSAKTWLKDLNFPIRGFVALGHWNQDLSQALLF